MVLVWMADPEPLARMLAACEAAARSKEQRGDA